MSETSLLHFYPERIAKIGAGVIVACFLVVLSVVFMLRQTDHSFSFSSSAKEKELAEAPLSFSLGLHTIAPVLPVPNLQSEMTFSFDPPRPLEESILESRLLVRLKKSSESKRVFLPCRLDLEFQKDRLHFAKEKSSFWIDLSTGSNEQIEGKWVICSENGQVVDADTFLVQPQDYPIQSAQELGENSPFRLLAEARFLGRDQLKERITGSGERLEISGSEILELNQDNWLIWKEQKWQKSAYLEKDLPIARIQSHSVNALILEGWDVDGYVRLSLNTAPFPPFKVRGEDLFSSIRVRSEKQISCILEKQCMVLKVGDFVLKTGGRWKVLRKEQDREALLNGKITGDVFVFEQILQKQGQKFIQGRLFNSNRTQGAFIEMPAQSTRKTTEKGRRGKGS